MMTVPISTSTAKEKISLVALYADIPVKLKNRLVREARARGMRLNRYLAEHFAAFFGDESLKEMPESDGPGRRAKELAEVK